MQKGQYFILFSTGLRKEEEIDELIYTKSRSEVARI